MVTEHAQVLKRLPSWIYKSLAQLWFDKEYPRHLFIELTSSCNLSCDYCPREKESHDMDWRVFTRIIDEARGFGPRSFSLHLFGEPLLYPRLLEACSYIKRSNPNHTILLTTNGILLKKHYQSLNNVGVDKIIWSYKKGQKIPKEVWSYKTVTVRFMEGEEKNFPRREVRKLHNYGGTVPSSNSSAMNTDGLRYPCYHLWFAPAVAWNGEILMCCADPKRKVVLGKIPNETVSQVWKSEKLKNIRNTHLTGSFEGICKNCNVWKSYPSMFFSWQYTG